MVYLIFISKIVYGSGASSNCNTNRCIIPDTPGAAIYEGICDLGSKQLHTRSQTADKWYHCLRTVLNIIDSPINKNV